MKFKFDNEVVNVTQIRQIGKVARRAALRGEMEETASHHFFPFSFAPLRAERVQNAAPVAAGTSKMILGANPKQCIV